MSVSFFVAGTPVPQGSKTAFVVGKRAVLTDANKDKLKPWRAEVTRVAGEAWAGRESLAGAVSVEVRFVFERPKTVKRDTPHVKPDIDKLLRALFDGVTDAKVWLDDAQVVRVTATKVYGAVAGVDVSISRFFGTNGGDKK